ncbi:MAG: hypothetical protein RIT81_06910 [Deltaproteobacteria bacterium]
MDLGRVVLIAAVLGPACHPTHAVTLPAPPDDAQAGVLAFDDEGGATAVGFSVDAAPPAASVSAGADVLVLYFDRPLESLGLAPGPIELGDARPFPRATVAHAAEVARGALVFESVEVDAPQVLALRRPEVPLEACFEGGGCYARPEDIAARICTAPCPNVAPMLPEPTELPVPPSFDVCPTGWSSGANGCVPPPRSPCAAHEAQWVGATACARIGSVCPAAGAWSAELPPGDVVYVRAGAVGGDGTTAAPYGTIVEAIAQSSGERVVALAPGTYAENVVLEDGVTLFGACVESTFVEAPNGVAITLPAGVARVANLTARGARIALETLATQPGNQLTLEDLAVEQNGTGAIVRAVGPVELIARRVVVRGGGEAAFNLGGGATGDLAQVVTQVRGRDLWATGADTHVVLSEAVLAEVGSGGDPTAIDVQQSANVDATAVAVLRQVGPALRARELGTATLDGVHIDQTNGDAVRAQGGGIIRLSRASIAGTAGTALDVETGTVACTDVTIGAARAAAPAIDLVAAAQVTLRRVHLEGAIGTGLVAYNVGTRIVAEDFSVVDTRPRSGAPTPSGDAITIYPGVRFEMRRVRIDDAVAAGFQVLGSRDVPPGPLASGHIEDLTIRRTGPRIDYDAYGLYFAGNVDADVERAHMEDIAYFGLLVAGGAVVRVTDLTLEDVFMGVRSDSVGDVSVERVSVVGSRAGALCVKADSHAFARDVTIADLVVRRESDDFEAFCAIGVPADASGVVVNNIATLDLARYSVARTEGIGMSLRGREGVVATDGAFVDVGLAAQLAPELPLEDVLVRTTFGGAGVPLDVQ